MQVASRPSSLGHIHGRTFARLRAAVLILGLLAAFALAPSVAHTQVSGLTCTISASAKGFVATFSGTISGSFSTPTWTLYFGDGASDSGSGASVSVTHTYSAFGTYTVTLDATGMSAAGGPVTGSCATRVTIQATHSVSAQESVSASDQATYIPPLHLADSVSVLDKPGNFISVLVNDAASVVDSPFLTGPANFNELANLTDRAVATLGSSGAFSPAVTVTFVAVGVVGAAVAAWWVLLSKRLPGRRVS